MAKSKGEKSEKKRSKQGALTPVADENKKLSFKEQWKALRFLPPLFRIIWKTNPSMLLGSLVMRLLKSFIPLAMLYTGKKIIDEIVYLMDSPDASQQALWFYVGLELGLAILSDLLNRAISLLDALLGDLFSNRTSLELIEHAAHLDLYQFEDAEFYDKLERARRQTTGRTVLMSMVLMQLQDIFSILFLAGGLIAFNPWLLGILFLAVIPSFLGETHFNSVSYSLSRSWTQERRELDYIRYIGASDQTAKEIKVFGLANFLKDKFAKLSDAYYEANKKVAVKRASIGSLLSALGTIAYYGAYVFILLQTIAGLITLGSLTFLSGSFQRMQSMLQGIMLRFSGIADNAMYVQDYFDFLAIKPAITSKPGSLPIPAVFQDGIRFENVSFKYPGSHKWAVRHLSFHLHPGEKLALVGENGAGKTTIVKLLARLYDPVEGRILLDGIDLREYNLQAWRNEVGIIFQDFIRFQMTAGENVAIGNIQERENVEALDNASSLSLANTVIDELPNRYNQLLGKRFANGVELSGGQWQKIALGRAYMREAQLLILDEPTAALDARAEFEVFERFSNLLAGKAAVLISHRFSTVRMADRILFLENGQLLEIGTHEELLEKRGKYADLFLLQARGYQ